MKIERSATYENISETGFGKSAQTSDSGVMIHLTSDEVATAIDAWLVAHGVFVGGARTIRVNGQLIDSGTVSVDPTGRVHINHIHGD